MATKTVKTKIINKHDVSDNWLKSSYKPSLGEIIIYDPDELNLYPRIKIGDGETIVSSLPFVDDNLIDYINGKSQVQIFTWEEDD